MAILPVNQMLDRPNFLGAAQQGIAFGNQQRALREQRADDASLRQLAPQVMQGDPAAFQQAAAISPEAAGKYQGAGDQVARRAEGLINYMKQVEATAGPAAAQAAWVRDGIPFVRGFANGAEPTQDWQQAKGMLGQLEARIAQAKAGQASQEQPTGFRELDMKARAAGYQPGTPEYERVMRVGVGVEGRAPTGGFGFREVIGADGRPRMGRMNPRTGLAEVYDETTGDFVPMGGGAALNGGEPMDAGNGVRAGQGATGAYVNVEGMDPAAQQQMAAGIAALRQANVSDAVVDAFAQSALSQPRTADAPSRANLFVGQSPAEKAAQETAARQQAELQFLPQRGAIEAQNAGAKEYATTQATIALAPQTAAAAGMTEEAKQNAQTRAELSQALPRMETEAQKTLALIDKARHHPGRVTGSGLSSVADPRNYVPGTDAYNFKVLMDQIRGGTFLQAFQSLKGGGAITQVEGQKAEQAIARLNAAQSDAELVNALDEFRQVVAGMPDSIRRKLAMAGGNGPTGGQPTDSPARPTSDAEYSALPSGALFIDPDDGKTYRKP